MRFCLPAVRHGCTWCTHHKVCVVFGITNTLFQTVHCTMVHPFISSYLPFVFNYWLYKGKKFTRKCQNLVHIRGVDKLWLDVTRKNLIAHMNIIHLRLVNTCTMFLIFSSVDAPKQTDSDVFRLFYNAAAALPYS